MLNAKGMGRAIAMLLCHLSKSLETIELGKVAAQESVMSHGAKKNVS